MKKEEKKISKETLLIYSPLLAFFIFLIIFIFLRIYFPKRFLLNYFIIGDNISLIVQLLGTIFAIIISITILGLQYFSQSLTPSITKSFIQKKFVLFLFFLYLSTIILGITTIFFPNIIPSTFATRVYYTFYTLFVLSILNIFYYIFFLIYNMQPEYVIKNIKNKISKEQYLQIVHDSQTKKNDISERFNEITSITVKSILSRDVNTFSCGLSTILDLLESYILGAIKEGKETYNLQLYLQKYYMIIFEEAYNSKNDMILSNFVIEMCSHIKGIFTNIEYYENILTNHYYITLGRRLISSDLNISNTIEAYFYSLPELIYVLLEKEEYTFKMLFLDYMDFLEESERHLDNLNYIDFSIRAILFDLAGVIIQSKLEYDEKIQQTDRVFECNSKIYLHYNSNNYGPYLPLGSPLVYLSRMKEYDTEGTIAKRMIVKMCQTNLKLFRDSNNEKYLGELIRFAVVLANDYPNLTKIMINEAFSASKLDFGHNRLNDFKEYYLGRINLIKRRISKSKKEEHIELIKSINSLLSQISTK